MSIKNDCEGRIIKAIGDNDSDSLDNYDWKDWLEIADYRSIIDKNYSTPQFSDVFSINIGENFKTKKEKLAWLTIVDVPKGKKHDALTRAEINKLWLVRDHLAQFAI